jgi:hypothetical protein
MKTIILNDINNSAESIIPYGLKLAVDLESEVDVLHVIDPRFHQGTYSSVSDSQSISPGNTLSHAETIKYEKHRISKEMDKLLSAEGSRLNYPLKINRLMVENSLEEELEHRVTKNPDCLLVLNAHADEDMLENTAEIVRLIKKTGIPAIVVPPGENYRHFGNVLMPLNLDTNNNMSIKNLKFLFKHFNMTVNAVGVASNGNYTELELKAIAWRDVAKEYVLPYSSVKTNILEGKDFIDTINNYFHRNNIDLFMMVNDNNDSKLGTTNTIRFLKTIKSPALVYFPN